MATRSGDADVPDRHPRCGLAAAGMLKPTMLVQAGSVVLNAALAPVLIVGSLTGKPFGAFGAGLATLIAALWLFGRAVIEKAEGQPSSET